MLTTVISSPYLIESLLHDRNRTTLAHPQLCHALTAETIPFSRNHNRTTLAKSELQHLRTIVTSRPSRNGNYTSLAHPKSCYFCEAAILPHPSHCNSEQTTVPRPSPVFFTQSFFSLLTRLHRVQLNFCR